MTAKYLTLARAVEYFGNGTPLGPWGRQNWDQGIAVVTVVVVCTIWFCLTALFYKRESADYKKAIEDFSATVERPIDANAEETGVATEDRQSGLIGWLCLPYGAVITLMALIPNPLSGRVGFIFCGLVLLVIGLVLVRGNQRKKRPLLTTLSCPLLSFPSPASAR